MKWYSLKLISGMSYNLRIPINKDFFVLKEKSKGFCSLNNKIIHGWFAIEFCHQLSPIQVDCWKRISHLVI